jgi:hypothetical protein
MRRQCVRCAGNIEIGTPGNGNPTYNEVGHGYVELRQFLQPGCADVGVPAGDLMVRYWNGGVVLQ